MTNPVLPPCACIELRQYTLHPGRRDALIELFDQRFLEPQEALGMQVLGQGRDLDDPDRFVWLRGFRDTAARAPALRTFYGGPVWQAHRAAANETMIDSDDVLLLRPVHAGAGLELPALRPAEPGTGLVIATVWMLASPVDDDFVRLFELRARPLLAERGGAPLAWYRTEYADNEFPQLPVRTGVHAFVWLASFATAEDHAYHRASLARSAAWRDVAEALASRFAAPGRELRLSPTVRSRLRHDPVACARATIAALATAAPSPATALPTGDVHDFDFLAGSWRVDHRRLVQRGVGSTEWETFSGTGRMAQHLGGMVNVEVLELPSKGWSGMTVRAFDVASRRWSIYWIDSRQGSLGQPVVGGFDGDAGVFRGDDVADGVPVQVVYHWTRRGPDAATWDQAFSRDGVTWETNWVMEFTRVPG